MFDNRVISGLDIALMIAVLRAFSLAQVGHVCECRSSDRSLAKSNDERSQVLSSGGH